VVYNKERVVVFENIIVEGDTVKILLEKTFEKMVIFLQCFTLLFYC
jgi:hypothetical protein